MNPKDLEILMNNPLSQEEVNTVLLTLLVHKAGFGTNDIIEASVIFAQEKKKTSHLVDFGHGGEA